MRKKVKYLRKIKSCFLSLLFFLNYIFYCQIYKIAQFKTALNYYPRQFFKHNEAIYMTHWGKSSQMMVTVGVGKQLLETRD